MHIYAHTIYLIFLNITASHGLHHARGKQSDCARSAGSEAVRGRVVEADRRPWPTLISVTGLRKKHLAPTKNTNSGGKNAPRPSCPDRDVQWLCVL